MVIKEKKISFIWKVYLPKGRFRSELRFPNPGSPERLKAVSRASHHIQKSISNLLLDVRTRLNVQINPHSTSWREGPDRRTAFVHLFCFSCCGPVSCRDNARVPTETPAGRTGGGANPESPAPLAGRGRGPRAGRVRRGDRARRGHEGRSLNAPARCALLREAEATRRRKDGRLPGSRGGNRRVGSRKGGGRESLARVGGGSQGRVWAPWSPPDVGGGSPRGRLTVPAPCPAGRGDPRPAWSGRRRPARGAGLGEGQGLPARRRAPRRSSGRGAAVLGLIPGAGQLACPVPRPSPAAPRVRPVPRLCRCRPRLWPCRALSLVPRRPATPPTRSTAAALLPLRDPASRRRGRRESAITPFIRRCRPSPWTRCFASTGGEG